MNYKYFHIKFSFRVLFGEVSRGEKMALRGTNPESYITEYTFVYEYYGFWARVTCGGRVGTAISVLKFRNVG